MDLHPGEDVVYEGHPTWRALLAFYLGGLLAAVIGAAVGVRQHRQSILQRILRLGTVDFDTAGTDGSDFRFVGIGNPDDVVAAVDTAQRESATR